MESYHSGASWGRKTHKYSKLQDVTEDKVVDSGPRVLSTLLVPYTVGSKLKEKVQQAEDQFVALTGGGSQGGRARWGRPGASAGKELPLGEPVLL